MGPGETTLQTVPVGAGAGGRWGGLGSDDRRKALFCFTAETMLAGEKEKMPEELLQLEEACGGGHGGAGWHD